VSRDSQQIKTSCIDFSLSILFQNYKIKTVIAGKHHFFYLNLEDRLYQNHRQEKYCL